MTSLTRFAAGICLAVAGFAQTNPYFGRGLWRGNVVDFQIIDGWAIVEGDIIAGRASDLTALYQALLGATTPEDKARVLDSIGVANVVRLWPGAVMPYEIDPKITDTTHIEEAVRHWNERTTLKLQARAGEASYVRFAPFSDPSICASSTLGMAGGQQYIYATELCGPNVLIHEIGHAVGLAHEQARSDRNQYVRILWENLTKPGSTQFGVPVAAQDVGPYDYNSIMHYGAGDFGKPAQPGMQTLPAGIPIRNSYVLSDGDIEGVNRLYGNVPKSFTISTTPPGLEVIVDGQAVIAPKPFAWTPGSSHTLDVVAVQNDDNGRYEFAHWSDRGDRSHTITAGQATTLCIANFVRYNRFTPQVTPPDGGTVSITPASDDGYYRDGTLVTFTARANRGYVFANWAGPYVEHNISLTNLAANPASTFALGDLQGFTARFVPAPAPTTPANNPVTRFISVLAGTTASAGAAIRVDGKLYRTPASFTWDPGSSHTVEVDALFPNATDQSLRTFQKWSDDGDRSRTITAPDTIATYTATYGIQYGIGRGTVGGGQVSADPAGRTGYYDQGTTVQLTATPTGLNQFAGWGLDLGGIDNPKPVVVKETLSAVAFFGATGGLSSFGIMNAARSRANAVIQGNGIYNQVSPGEVVVLNVPGFGPDQPAVGVALDIQLPTLLSGVRALFGGVAARIVAVEKGRVTALVPLATSALIGKGIGVQMEYLGLTTSPGLVLVTPANPAIYTADASGAGAADATNEDGTHNDAEHPAAKGSLVTFYAQGLGITNPTSTDGRVWVDPGPPPAGALEVRIGGSVAEVVRAVMAPGKAGICRIQARVPSDARTGAATPLIVTLDGAPSQFDVTIAVQ